ncbi:hypothetical protein [Streptomyces sp. NPDC058045]|uniref:hypothetical protein n=1 Tax=Streptomyces sp. NPDC058045 TaxID=3346311 RepID=UPI0036F0CA23
MPHVRGHYRRDGSYVRPHTRRPRGSAANRLASPAPAPALRTTVPRPRAATAGAATTHVRGHYRRDGSYVRPHVRRVSGPGAVAVGGGGVLLLLLLVLALLTGNGGTDSHDAPGKQPTAEVGSHAR